MKMTRRMWVLGVPVLIAGCAAGGEATTGKTGDLPIFNTAGMSVSAEGIIDFGTTLFATNPTTLLEPPMLPLLGIASRGRADSRAGNDTFHPRMKGHRNA